jgi:hypothetical protein
MDQRLQINQLQQQVATLSTQLTNCQNSLRAALATNHLVNLCAGGAGVATLTPAKVVERAYAVRDALSARMAADAEAAAQEEAKAAEEKAAAAKAKAVQAKAKAQKKGRR